MVNLLARQPFLSANVVGCGGQMCSMTIRKLVKLTALHSKSHCKARNYHLFFGHIDASFLLAILMSGCVCVCVHELKQAKKRKINFQHYNRAHTQSMADTTVSDSSGRKHMCVHATLIQDEMCANKNTKLTTTHASNV